MRTFGSEKTSTGLLSFLLFCLSLALTSYTSRNQDGISLGKKIVAESIRPFSVVTYGAYDSVRNIWDKYINLIGVQDYNQKLISRLNALETVNSQLTELEKENTRLKNLLQSKQSQIPNSIAARVIGYDPSGWVQSVTLNRGSQDGIRVNSAVVESAGVVGQVISVSPNTSRVLLITDRASNVDGLIQESRTRGVLEGNGTNFAEFRYVNESDAVQIGDKIISSGMDLVYPKGLVLGVVINVTKSSGGLFKSVKVSPVVSFSKLEDVLVITKVPTEG